MRPTEPSPALLPHVAPASPYLRLALFAIRRMAVGGIADAHAAHAIFTGFGLGYRRPLVLLRTLMTELSRVSTVKLTVAPYCCPRVTRDEAMLLNSIAEAPLHPEQVHAALSSLLRVRSCLGVLSPTQMMSGRASRTRRCSSLSSSAFRGRNGGQYVPAIFTPGNRASSRAFSSDTGMRPSSSHAGNASWRLSPAIPAAPAVRNAPATG